MPDEGTIRTCLKLVLAVGMGMAAAGQLFAMDLLERYPTSLPAGDAAPERARTWSFSKDDIYRLSEFRRSFADGLQVEMGMADLGIGHSADGAVWAVILPQAEGFITSEKGREPVTHIWVRFHPAEVTRLFPPDSVIAQGAKEGEAEMRAIANFKISSSWQAQGRAMIPERNELTIDADTAEGARRFFVVDSAAETAQYVEAFERRAMPRPPPISRDLAEQAFDQLWTEFDRRYAIFVLRPEVNWAKLREQFRPRAVESKSVHALAGVLAKMLRPLRDLHIGIQAAGAEVPVYERSRRANANPRAAGAMVGELKAVGRSAAWGITRDGIGYLAIYQWSDPALPDAMDEVLEKLRETRALVLDVRLNGGGSEPVARQLAGRFLENEFTYAFSQFRNGPEHGDLTPKRPRVVSPRGPWRYGRPVLVLIGERCLSSNESFIAMMTGSTNVTTMGERTGGSSGNPERLNLPLQITVSLPQWIDYLPDGSALDERGIQPQIPFTADADGFSGDRDDLLRAALDRLRTDPP